MEVIRQDTNGRSFERLASLNRAISPAEPIDLPYEQITRSVGKCDGKEESAALNSGTAIS